MNKYQRAINKTTRYDFEFNKALGGEFESFRATRIGERILHKTFNKTFEDLVFFKNNALRVLNDIDNFKKNFK